MTSLVPPLLSAAPPRVEAAGASTSAEAQAPASTQWLALDRQLCFALYASTLAMTRLYKPLLAPLGLTYPQYLSLLVLWEHGASAPGLMVSELGERLALDSGTLTPLLKRLETQGLLLRQRDPADERRVRLNLTPAGWALRDTATQVPRQVLCAVGCDIDEVARLTQQLHRLRQQLDQAAGQAPAFPAE